jgi:hypothetical protein
MTAYCGADTRGILFKSEHTQKAIRSLTEMAAQLQSLVGAFSV